MSSEESGDVLAPMRGRGLISTHDWATDELDAVLNIAHRLEQLERSGKSTVLLPNEAAVALTLDRTTHTSRAWAGAAARLGMHPVMLDGTSADVADSCDPEEIGMMLGMNAHAIGVRHDGAFGAGTAFVRGVQRGVDEYLAAIDDPRPVPVVNLECDADHPIQALGDLLWIEEHLGRSVAGRTVAVTWAFSESCERPLSVPQSLISLFTRFGADVRLAHPPGYDLRPEVMRWALEGARQSGGSFQVVDKMDEAFAGADIVYPVSWAPIVTLRQRASTLSNGGSNGGSNGDSDALDAITKRALELGAQHRDWICDEHRMSLAEGALYLHPMRPQVGAEVSADVYAQHRTNLARQARKQLYVLMAVLAATKVDGLAGRL